jgi:polyhydroxybutyrate depolymerase
MPRYIYITLFFLLTTLFMFNPASAQDGENGTLDYGGVERSYYLYVPDSYDESQPVPLAIALHPTSSSGKAMAVLTGLDAAAETQGFIVVYPNTDGSVWGEDPTDAEAPDDLGFIPALIDHLAETYAIDPARVYLTGWGNGGLMAYRLACEVPERFESVAVVGSLLWERHRTACPAEPAAPVNMLIIHGTDDIFYTHDTHLYESIWNPESYTLLGVDATMAFWVSRNGCDLTSVEMDDQSRLFDSCQDGTRVAFYDVQGARSNWPRTGPYKLNAFGVDATEMITDFFAGSDDWNVPQPPFEGQARTYVVYVPSSYDPAEPMPVVITLHGRFGTGAGTADYTGMNPIAEREGFIGLYPDGLVYPGATYPYDTGWNYQKGVPFLIVSDPDDGAFITDLLDDLALDLNIDQRRIYVDGMSNGGYMVYNLACSYPERFAAYADVAGSGYMGFADMCNHGVPVSVLIIHGTADDNVLWNGQMQNMRGREVWVSYPITDMVAFWVAHNTCNVEAADVTDLPSGGESPGTAVRVITLDECADDSEVQLYAVLGGGHNWPGVRDEGATERERLLINMDIHASEVIWEFFSRHARPEN